MRIKNKPTTNRGNYGYGNYKQIEKRKQNTKDSNCNIDCIITFTFYPKIRGKTI